MCPDVPGAIIILISPKKKKIPDVRIYKTLSRRSNYVRYYYITLLLYIRHCWAPWPSFPNLNNASNASLFGLVINGFILYQSSFRYRHTLSLVHDGFHRWGINSLSLKQRRCFFLASSFLLLLRSYLWERGPKWSAALKFSKPTPQTTLR